MARQTFLATFKIIISKRLLRHQHKKRKKTYRYINKTRGNRSRNKGRKNPVRVDPKIYSFLQISSILIKAIQLVLFNTNPVFIEVTGDVIELVLLVLVFRS